MTKAARSRAERLDRWMRDHALPLWACAPRDPEGGFYEALDFNGAPMRMMNRRVRVQFRQIYVLSAASLLGLAPEGARIALQTLHVTRNRAWAKNGAPGWAHILGPDGTVIDDTRDAYDHAFALFAFAWLWRATGDPAARRAVDETLGFVDRALSARSGGFWETANNQDNNENLRRQNPHMHALEAFLALYEAFGDRDYLDRARQIFHLFAGRFYDWQNRCVIEYFDLDWRPAHPRMQRVEPGHMAEWVFLLREYERLAGDPVSAIADGLYEKLRIIGFDDDGRFLVDEMSLDGNLTKNTRRLWPQTEFIRASLAQFRTHGDERYRAEAIRALQDLENHYLATKLTGGWNDTFDLSGKRISQSMPVSTLYHIFGAFVFARDLLRRPTAENTLKSSATNSKVTGSAMSIDQSRATSRRITPVILAGGPGTRLWPVSTPETPKQFLRLVGERTLFQETLARVADDAVFEPAIVVSGERYGDVIAEQASAVDHLIEMVLLEPVARNSAPAIAAAAYAAAPDAHLLVMPADHLIRETALFHGLVEGAAAAAQRGAIVTFGITPTRPETGFGYIKAGAPLGEAGAFEVEAFVEKPTLETARAYIANGSYLWNSGMFLFEAAAMRAELERLAPEVAAAAAHAVAHADVKKGMSIRMLDAKHFGTAPSISIDYAVMEKTDRAAVCPAALTWSDIGGWDALADAQTADADGNHVDGPGALLNCANVFARSDSVKIAAIGLTNIVVVAAGDTILIADRGSVQSIREVADMLAKQMDTAKNPRF